MATIPAGTKFIGIDASVPTPELNGKRINDKTQHYTVEDIAAFAGVGSQGPQGVEGPAGPPGPVGPAGLEWRGAWNTNSSYAVDDAVGFNGSSWFCIADVTGTGNSNPEVDTISWALLAAQGATGPQGAQGPTGPQGAQGPGATQTLQQTVNLGNTVLTGSDTLTVLGGSVKMNNFLGGKIEMVNGTTTKPYFRIGLPSSGGKTVTLTSADTQTDSRTIKLPDASGTIALQTYKEFTARIFQGNILNPITLTVIKNDFSSVPTVENDFGSPYDFLVTLEDEFVFEKTVVTSTPERTNIIISYPSNDDSTVAFNCFDFTGEQAAPISFTFTIKVYN